MNILLSNITYKPHVGGVENSLFYIGKTLLNKGHKVIILCSDQGINREDRLKEHEIIDGLEVIRYKRYIPTFRMFIIIQFFLDIYRTFLIAKNIYAQYPLDMVIARNTRVGLGIRLALSSVFFVYVVPSIIKYLDQSSIKNKKLNIFSLLKWVHRDLLLYNIDSRIQKKLIKKSDKVVVFSQNMKRQVIEISKKNEDEINIFKPGVDYNLFKSDNSIKDKNFPWKTKGHGKVFLILGRIVQAKKINMAIEAFSKIKKTGSTLVIVGEGPELGNLKLLTKKLDLGSSVFFLKYSDEPHKFYQMADVFISTSIYESFGQTIIEAMSSELPILAFKSDGRNVRTAINELVANNKNGILCSTVTKVSQKDCYFL